MAHGGDHRDRDGLGVEGPPGRHCGRPDRALAWRAMPSVRSAGCPGKSWVINCADEQVPGPRARRARPVAQSRDDDQVGSRALGAR